ncbi:lytic transglycosylase [Rhodococcus triatomae]|uniref:lytic transglycosylase domain-containing protein n=1 Tax=Rhodococcus triatomae TaxID=300028 RepID=UPI0009341088|nr:lytic murein transglycosylase [Rhodococcus triatomae]QNG18082.1 lytic transglycosylase [Rhodococcus triatomae]QNG22248.1 lytic transglycosylase [Rhodococcus triatomae]
MRIRGLLTAAVLIAGASATAVSSTGVVATTGAEPLAVVAEPPLSGPDTELGAQPPAGFVPPTPRVPRSQRTVPPPPAPAMQSPEVPAMSGLIAAPIVLSALGIPEIILNAYRAAELEMMIEKPGCGLPWHLLAGIGRIESGHAGGGRTDAVGTTLTPILGPTLDGHLAGNEIIRDTDGGLVDGDPLHDRAVGPMQFIPSTWARYASDGNADGVADPHNVFDAALAAGRYLCSGDLDLRDASQLQRAVLRYNNSSVYAANVLTWSEAYARGTTPNGSDTPGGTAPSPTPSPAADLAATPAAPAAPPDPDEVLPDATPVPDVIDPTLTEPAPAFPGLPPLPDLSCLFCPPTERASAPPQPAPAPPEG